MKMTIMLAALAALFIIACGDETDPIPNAGKTTGEVVFDTFKDYKDGTNAEGTTSTGSTDPNSGMPCENSGKDENGDGVITDCGNSVPGDPGTGGGYGAMPLCPEIIGLNFDTCRPEMGRPVFIIDFSRSCVLGMKCDYQTDPGQACPMVWAPVCGTDGWTYDNDCFAKVAGVGIAYPGECIGDPTQCPPADPAKPSCVDGSYLKEMFDDRGCLVGFACVGNDQNCPDLAYPAPDFCPNGKIEYVYDAATGCAVAFECVDYTDPTYCNTDADCGEGMYCINGVCNYGDPFDCPVGMPNPADYCADGTKMVPIYDERGCVKEWTCEGTPTDPTNPAPCKMDSDCGAGLVCVNGQCYAGDPTDPSTGCPAIDLKMPDCGNMKPEPIYDAAGCLTGYACPL